MQTLNIVTAVSRPKNLPSILRSMDGALDCGLKVRWLIVYDDPPGRPKEIDEVVAMKSAVSVVPVQWTGGPFKLGIKQKNFGIDHCERGFYHLLDDDNKCHPMFFNRIAEEIEKNPGKQAFAFHQHRWDQYGDMRASRERMYPTAIDNTMFVVHTDFIGKARYNPGQAGFEDGWFFHDLYRSNPATWVFIDEFLAYFNFLKQFPKTVHPAAALPDLDIFVIGYRSEAQLPRLFLDLGATCRTKYNLTLLDNTGNPRTLTRAWNDLWQQTRSQYVAILNPDVCLSPGWDEKLLLCLQERPDVAVALCNRYFGIGGGIPDAGFMSAAAAKAVKSYTDLGEHLEGFYAFMARRSALERLKGFDERFRFYYSDSDLQLRAMRFLGMKTTQVNHALVAHIGAVSTHDADRRGELDRVKELEYAAAIKRRVESKELKLWHELSDDEILEVRQDPVYSKLPVKGAPIPVKDPAMKLTIDNIYSPSGRRALIEAYVKSMWADGIHNKTIWAGVPTLQLPEDLLMMSELIWVLRPKVVVECGIWQGGGLVFYASLMDLIGHGDVIGVDIDISRALHVKKHPHGGRIRLIQGSSADPDVAKMITPAMAGGNAIVILDSNHEAAHVKKELERFAPLIKSGSYLIVMDGVMRILHDVPGGDASWKTNNPETALSEFLASHPEFERDPNCNKFGATHGPGGYLRRK